MKLNFNTVKSYASLFSMGKAEDSIVLSVKERCMYFTDNNKVAGKIIIELSSVSEDEEDALIIIPKEDLLHLIPYSESITINKDYTYKTDNNIKGKFQSKETDKYLYEAIKDVFENEADYTEYFNISSKDDYDTLSTASKFTNSLDKSSQAKFVFLQNGVMFSSSLYRIYSKKVSTNTPDPICILNDLVSIIKVCGFPTTFYKKDNSILIKNDNVHIIFANIEKVDPINIFDDRFTSLKETLFNSNKLVIDANELVSKMDYLRFYAKNDNNRTNFRYDNNSLCLSVKDKNCTIDNILSDSKELIDFNFNIDLLNSALKFFTWKEDSKIRMYISKETNIFCVSLNDDDTEVFYSSKFTN